MDAAVTIFESDHRTWSPLFAERRMDAFAGLGSTVLMVSRRALLHNAAMVRRRLPAGLKLRLTLQNDACGHGLRIVTQTLSSADSANDDGGGVDELAVLTLNDAYACGLTPFPLCVLEPVTLDSVRRWPAQIELAVERGWTLTVDRCAVAQAVGRVAARVGRRARVEWLSDCDGDDRVGWPCDADRLAADDAVRVVGVRLASDTMSTWTSGEPFPRRTNGAVVSAYQPIRTAVSPYGTDEADTDGGSIPVMRWLAELTTVRAVREGETVNHGFNWRAPRAMTVGVLSVGHAYGYPPEVAGRAVVLVNGIPCPVVGRVAADALYIDLTAVPAARPLQAVTVIDDEPGSPAGADRIARLIDCTAAEVLTHIGSHVPRTAVDGPPIAARTYSGSKTTADDHDRRGSAYSDRST